jgi:hypothetical protein
MKTRGFIETQNYTRQSNFFFVEFECFNLQLMLLAHVDRQTLSGPVDDPSKLPKWNFDGSSTGQATGDDSEVILWYHALFASPLSPLHLTCVLACLFCVHLLTLF